MDHLNEGRNEVRKVVVAIVVLFFILLNYHLKSESIFHNFTKQFAISELKSTDSTILIILLII